MLFGDGLPFERFVVQRFAGYKKPLPANLLDRIIQGINYAFERGSARVIDEWDLFHCHLLYSSDSKERRLDSPDGILFHAQYHPISPEQYLLRNVQVNAGGKAEVLPCELGQSVRKQFPGDQGLCTVRNEDLSLDEGVTIFFVNIETLSRKELQGYEPNIRTVRGQKIVFGVPDFTEQDLAKDGIK